MKWEHTQYVCVTHSISNAAFVFQTSVRRWSSRSRRSFRRWRTSWGSRCRATSDTNTQIHAEQRVLSLYSICVRNKHWLCPSHWCRFFGRRWMCNWNLTAFPRGVVTSCLSGVLVSLFIKSNLTSVQWLSADTCPSGVSVSDGFTEQLVKDGEVLTFTESLTSAAVWGEADLIETFYCIDI